MACRRGACTVLRVDIGTDLPDLVLLVSSGRLELLGELPHLLGLLTGNLTFAELPNQVLQFASRLTGEALELAELLLAQFALFLREILGPARQLPFLCFQPAPASLHLLRLAVESVLFLSEPLDDLGGVAPALFRVLAGPRNDLFRQTVALRDSDSVTRTGYTDEKLVRRRQGFYIELNRGVPHILVGVAVTLECTVMGCDHRVAAAIAQLVQNRHGQRGTFGRVGPRAELV